MENVLNQMTASNINTDSVCISNLTLTELCWTCDRGSSLLRIITPTNTKNVLGSKICFIHLNYFRFQSMSESRQKKDKVLCVPFCFLWSVITRGILWTMILNHFIDKATIDVSRTSVQRQRIPMLVFSCKIPTGAFDSSALSRAFWKNHKGVWLVKQSICTIFLQPDTLEKRY